MVRYSQYIDLNVAQKNDVCVVQVASCGLQQILQINYCSSLDYDLLIYQTFELNPHYQVTISFNFWRIDQWNNYQFYLYADHQIIYNNVFQDTAISTNLCGSSSYQDEIIPISRKFEHSSTTIFILMMSQKGVWGISDFILSIENCPTGCNSCDSTGCFDEYLFIQQFVSRTVGPITNNEGWLKNGIIETTPSSCSGIQCLRVFATQLEKTYNLKSHLKISFSIRVFVLNSYQTEIKILIDDALVYSTEYSGGWIADNSAYEFCYFLTQKQINIRQYPHNGSTVKITILTTQNKHVYPISPWMCIRDVQLFLGTNSNVSLCNDNNKFAFDGCFSSIYDCVEGCSNCIQGTCLNCLLGWEYQVFDKTCIPICGDGIITGLEECDDGNQIRFDGCYQCQFSCISECQLCEFGYCLQCNPSFKLSYDKQECLPQCNNNEISKYYGYYHDSNDECSETCQLECQQCIDSKCYLCEEGWQLRDNNCIQLCGDGQIADFSIEQCDDINNDPNDGCFECRLECLPYCLVCVDISTCVICEDNFQIVDQVCRPICGDGIIISGQEDCDDGNNQPYDGCFECQFQCSKGCLDCEQGNVCKKCNYQYVLDKETELCQEIQNGNQTDINDSLDSIQMKRCGDGILDNIEQCDDGNFDNLDGCSNQCIIEDKWDCVDINFQSRCFLLTQLSLSYINHTNPYQYVQLSFTHLVRLNEPITDLIPRIKFTIDDLSVDYYNYSIQEVIPVNEFELTQATYLLAIQFYSSMIDPPIVTVSVDASLVDENNFDVDKSPKQLKLQTFISLNSDQIAAAKQLYNFAFWIIVGLAVCSFLLIIFGDLSQFTEILDVLQYQSYLKFINVKYPENLEIYFQSSELVSMQPLLINLKIDSFFENVFDYYYLDGPGKFQEYQINADLLTNLYGLFVQLACFLLLYIFLKYFKRFSINYWFTSVYVQKIKLSKSILLEQFALKGYNLSKHVLATQFLYSLKGLTQIFYANSWDLSFKVLIFLISMNHYTLRSIISIFVSILYFIVLILIIDQNLITNYFKISPKVVKAHRLDVIILFKKLLFLTTLTGIQNDPIYQCFLLAQINFTYVIFIIIINFKSLDLDFIMNVWIEAPVMLFTILNIAYVKEFSIYFTPNQFIHYGFCQTGILLLGLLGPLIKCFIKFYQKVKPLILTKAHKVANKSQHLFTLANQ
ncbi:unnamed protein product (macronuclear) [Paramecium tetraurelia]|uniref:EGF-like domain-containing protein n=1 Tax=Paramecium tetraurelia TaxID=5888 RepID=A0DI96_PARTE|nr:uncharacterized protein GSPATT00017135001 [Paramecium tetraurelia]CAK82763.1 unnamed protein product [Paramecium tetraurelia]|eukprot:XP_001450160.1 hypothetical protein (macronuclear) [Paramecium tetraurelia strain d4-2]